MLSHPTPDKCRKRHRQVAIDRLFDALEVQNWPGAVAAYFPPIRTSKAVYDQFRVHASLQHDLDPLIAMDRRTNSQIRHTLNRKPDRSRGPLC
jgi:hypothetical protein